MEEGAGGGTEERHSGSAGPTQCGQWPTSATPRSEIFSVPPVVSSRLPGLMSLCTMPWLCRYSRPSTSWQKYLQGQWRPGVTQRDPRQEATAWEPLRLGKQKGQDSSLSENQGPPARLSCFWAPGPPLVSPDQAALHYASHLLKGHVTHIHAALAWIQPRSRPGTRDPGLPRRHPLHSHHRPAGPAAMWQGGGGGTRLGGLPRGSSQQWQHRPLSGASKDQGISKPEEQAYRSRGVRRAGCQLGVPQTNSPKL